MATRSAFQQALEEADRSFSETGDVLDALSWVGFAAKAGEPIPTRIAAWLKAAIDAYRSGEAETMDAAMGLVQRGRGPRRRAKERGALQAAIARMYVLHVCGATIDDAATLVARLTPDFTINTLIDRYKRSGSGRSTRRDRAALRSRWSRADLELILAEYPDQPLPVAQAKAAIRKVYARSAI